MDGSGTGKRKPLLTAAPHRQAATLPNFRLGNSGATLLTRGCAAASHGLGLWNVATIQPEALLIR